MTNKVIERVAEAIGDAIHSYECEDGFPPWSMPTLAAKAALEAAGVIVLPADAEPEVGDVAVHPMVNNVYELTAKEDAAWAKRVGMKIIQRQGRPVIMEEA